MKRIKIASSILGSMLLFGQSLLAQSIELSLDEALNQALLNNNEVKIKQQEVTVATYNLQKTNSVFLPKVRLSEVGMQTDDPLAAFGFLLQQRSVETADFNPDRLNQPDDAVNWQTQIAVEQPLINVDGFYARKAANYQVQAYGKIAERTKQFIQFHVKEAYFGLQLAKQQKEVIQKAYQVTQETYGVTQNQVEQGLVREADLLKVKVRLLDLQHQLTEADYNIENVNNQLSYLVTGKIGTVYTITDSLVIDDFVGEELLMVSQERADLQALFLTNKSYKYQMKMNQSKFIPRLNAFGQYNLNDTKVFGSQATSYMVGVSLNWKVFDGGNNLAESKKSNALFVQSSMELEKAKQEASLELSKAQKAVKLAKNKLQLLDLAIIEAEESYRLTIDLFQEGTETVVNLLGAEVLLSRKRLQYQVAIYKYYIALSNVELQAK